VPVNQARRCPLDLLENARRSALGIDVQPFQRGQFRLVAGADAKLEFRATDFDAEIHCDSGFWILDWQT
jgi:hypothetical protein